MVAAQLSTKPKIQNFLENEHLITGRVYAKGPVYRNMSNKWYVPRFVYLKDTYPDYTNGKFFE
jgi:hypothetical protein